MRKYATKLSEFQLQSFSVLLESNQSKAQQLKT